MVSSPLRKRAAAAYDSKTSVTPFPASDNYRISDNCKEFARGHSRGF